MLNKLEKIASHQTAVEILAYCIFFLHLSQKKDCKNRASQQTLGSSNFVMALNFAIKRIFYVRTITYIIYNDLTITLDVTAQRRR